MDIWDLVPRESRAREVILSITLVRSASMQPCDVSTFCISIRLPSFLDHHHSLLSPTFGTPAIDALRKYGDLVRIAPNELVLFTPKALHDIYSPTNRRLEIFIKTDFQSRGANLGGIIWEEDPVKHRKVARKLFPAYSPRSIRSFEPLMHKHMDYFVERMKELGTQQRGVNIVDWTHWVAWDVSRDIAWCEGPQSMSNEKDPFALDVFISFNAFATMIRVFKRFPLLSPVKYLFAPVKKLSCPGRPTTATTEEKKIKKSKVSSWKMLFKLMLPSTLGLVPFRNVLRSISPMAASSHESKR